MSRFLTERQEAAEGTFPECLLLVRSRRGGCDHGSIAEGRPLGLPEGIVVTDAASYGVADLECDERRLHTAKTADQLRLMIDEGGRPRRLRPELHLSWPGRSRVTPSKLSLSVRRTYEFYASRSVRQWVDVRLSVRR